MFAVLSLSSLTKVKTAFVNSLCYLNAAIMQLNLHLKLTSRSSSRALVRKSDSIIAAKCDVTTALVRQNDVKKS